ncbi:MAG: NUDIX domain-containing protein [Patescibacteria group bacterium]
MNHLQKDGPEEVAYKGKIFEIIKQPMKADGKSVVLEIARRSPGVRLIIIKDNQLLITKEFRTELNAYDYRLPGGKVFDTLEEYERHRSQDMLPCALEAAKRECKEETGFIVKNINHFTTAHAGATVEWDLFYFIVNEFENSAKGQELEVGEVISIEWKTFEEVKELCKEGEIREDRTIGVLFKFFLRYQKHLD